MTEDKELKNELKKSYKKSIGIIVAILLVTATVIAIIDAMQYQSTEDAYIENHTVQVAPKVAGQIVAVYIKDNQTVKEGDLVAEIDNADYKVKLEQAEANYQSALKSQNIAKANLSAVDAEIALAKKDVDRYTKLYETGSVSKQTLDNAITKYEAVKARQENAEQAILTKSQTNVADADIKVLKAKRDQAQLDLSYTKIYAPQDGTVSSKRVEKGAYVQVGSPLFVIVPNEVWVVANFKENQLEKMRVGQSVEIKVDTYPKHKFKGKVDSIQRASGAKASLFPPENAVGSFVKIVQRIPVKIIFTEEINPEQYLLVPGMSVIPKVRVADNVKENKGCKIKQVEKCQK
mgnify:CR=1 FL=1